jgi:hypothetical protein
MGQLSKLDSYYNRYDHEQETEGQGVLGMQDGFCHSGVPGCSRQSGPVFGVSNLELDTLWRVWPIN